MSVDDESVPVDDPVADAMRSALRRSAADGPATTGEWTDVALRAGRVVRTRRLVAAGACVALFGAGAVVLATRPGNDSGGVKVDSSATTTTSGPKTTTTVLDLATADNGARRQAATDFANQMLADAIVPPGAQRSNAPPPPGLTTGSGGFGTVYNTELSEHQIWSISETPAAVATFVETHVPRGYASSGTGSETQGTVRSLTLLQATGKVPPVIDAAELTWKIIDGPGGGSLIRLDAVVTWIPRLPPEVPRKPALLATRAAGCPSSIEQYHDVDNAKTSRGPLLLPSLAPTGALLCSYQDPAHRGALTAQRILDAGRAGPLADAIRKMNLKPDISLHSCPPGNGTTGILIFSFAGHADAALWWGASGCQYLDNGYAASVETGNPTFYRDFLSAIAASRG